MWWKEIPNQPNYEASDTGLIRNKKTKRILKPGKSSSGHLRVMLSHNGIQKGYSVQSLIKRTFHGEPDVVVHHIDENKTNNHIDNLEYKFNAQHVSDHMRKYPLV